MSQFGMKGAPITISDDEETSDDEIQILPTVKSSKSNNSKRKRASNSIDISSDEVKYHSMLFYSIISDHCLL